MSTRQATILNGLLDPRRLARIEGGPAFGESSGYSLAEYFGDLRRVVWTAGARAGALDAGRRAVHRVYLERMAALLDPPAAAPTATGGGAPAALPSPLLATPNVSRSDVPALVRSQLKSIRDQARRDASAAESGSTARAHWQDVADRIDVILEPDRR